jgi:hypothetical protein
MRIYEVYQGKINWVKPNTEREYEEVLYQLENYDPQHMPDWAHERLKQLADKRVFRAAVARAKVRKLSRNDIRSAGNTGDTWAQTLKWTEPAKSNRAATLYGKDKKVERPVYLQDPTSGELWLLGGHHRSTYVTDVLKQPVEVAVL